MPLTIAIEHRIFTQTKIVLQLKKLCKNSMLVHLYCDILSTQMYAQSGSSHLKYLLCWPYWKFGFKIFLSYFYREVTKLKIQTSYNSHSSAIVWLNCMHEQKIFRIHACFVNRFVFLKIYNYINHINIYVKASMYPEVVAKIFTTT